MDSAKDKQSLRSDRGSPVRRGVMVAFGTLVLVNVIAGELQREELTTVPDSLHGTWEDIEGLNTIRVSREGLRRRWEDEVRDCRVDAVVRYLHSPFPFAGYLMGEPSTALICDSESTRRQHAQRSLGIDAPADFRKTYDFRESSEGWMTIEETEYMSQGWDGSEGVYRWTIGDFFRR